MTRFLKRAASPERECPCGGCVFWVNEINFLCVAVELQRGVHPDCSQGVFVETPRPPDGTRCRDFDGNLKIVGVDV